jgi:hypothetical protein
MRAQNAVNLLGKRAKRKQPLRNCES